MTHASRRIGRSEIQVVVGDLTQAQAEAIVNAANSELWMGGGVAGAIKRAAGDHVERKAMEQGPISPGEAVATTAGALPRPIRWIIHAATMGPDLSTSEPLIRAATESALAKASELGAASIAMPALGTGVGGFSMERAADAMTEVAANAAREGRAPERILFVVRSEEAAQAFEAALGRR